MNGLQVAHRVRSLSFEVMARIPPRSGTLWAMTWRSQVGLVALAAVMVAGCSSSTGSTAVPGARPATSTPTTAAQSAAHGVEAAISAVPWSKVGPGWMLATWSPVPGERPGGSPPPGAPKPETATTTLYLVDPAGGRYAVTTFGPASNGAPRVIDWSGDGRHALLDSTLPGPQTMITEVDLHSGTQATFTVNGFVTPRYTRPEGKAVLLATWRGYGPGSLKRVDPAGNLELTYPVGPDFGGGYLSAPDGTQLVLGTASGLALIGNDGTAGAALPIAGEKDCAPMRWWDAGSTIAVTSCSDHGLARLWLVPVGGGTPTALTAPLSGQGPDYGDENAWQLRAGTFVQEAGACGSQYLGKLSAVGGTTTRVSVPGVDNTHSVVVVGVNGGDLDLHATASCGGGQSLFDYNPAAGTSTVLLGPPINGGGVIAAVPYPGQR
jgi:hypothetical protein